MMGEWNGRVGENSLKTSIEGEANVWVDQQDPCWRWASFQKHPTSLLYSARCPPNHPDTFLCAVLHNFIPTDLWPTVFLLLLHLVPLLTEDLISSAGIRGHARAKYVKFVSRERKGRMCLTPGICMCFFLCPLYAFNSVAFHHPNHIQVRTTFFLEFGYIYLCERLEHARATVDLRRLK